MNFPDFPLIAFIYGRIALIFQNPSFVTSFFSNFARIRRISLYKRQSGGLRKKWVTNCRPYSIPRSATNCSMNTRRWATSRIMTHHRVQRYDFYLEMPNNSSHFVNLYRLSPKSYLCMCYLHTPVLSSNVPPGLLVRHKA